MHLVRLVGQVGGGAVVVGVVAVRRHPLVPRRVIPLLRGLHSFIFQLNVSAFCGIGSGLRVCLRVILQVFRRCRGVLGVFRVYFMSEAAQAELKLDECKRVILQVFRRCRGVLRGVGGV